jgi:hypothetical protein
MELLLENGADPNAVNKVTQTSWFPLVLIMIDPQYPSERCD